MTYRLITPQNQVGAGAKVELLTKLIDIPVELDRLPYEKWKQEEYLKKHPLGKVPTL